MCISRCIGIDLYRTASQQTPCQTEKKFWHEICSRKKIQNFSRLPLDKSDIVCIMVEMKERKLGERKMSMMIQSDCCGEPMSGSQIDHEICPRCGEHCEVVSDES